MASWANIEDAKAMARVYPGSSDINHLEVINRWDVPQGFAYLEGLRGHVYISRPDCNLFTSSMILNEQASNHPGFKEFAGSSRNPHPTNLALAKILQRNTGYPSAFILPFTNRVKGYSPEDQRLDSLDHGETYYGNTIKYAKHATQSRKAGSISLTFEDYRSLSLYKLVTLWTEYAESVFLGKMSPREEYIWRNEIDYGATLFFFATRSNPYRINPNGQWKDGYELVYWEKLTGLYPVTRPDSAFAYTKGQFIEPEFTVQFDYSLKSKSSILDPIVISEFNIMSGWQHNPNTTVAPSWTYKPDGTVEQGNFHVQKANIFRHQGKFYWEYM